MSDRVLKESDVLRAIDNRIKELSIDPQFVQKHGIIDVMGVKKHVLAIPSADVPQWIPCSERLPDNGITTPCLMTMLYPRSSRVGVVYGYRCYKNIWVYVTTEGFEYTEAGIAEVIAWMPLPKPWKGVDDETD